MVSLFEESKKNEEENLFNENSSSLVENFDHENSNKIPRTVWIIGVVMFMANTASVIVYTFGAVYIKDVLSVDRGTIGAIEGAVEAFSYLMKLLSGVLSDILNRRKLLMVLGYGIIVFGRFIIAAFSKNFWAIFSGRCFERIGNGMQAAPRSALVGDISPKKRIGASYGLKRSLGMLGSVFGTICAIIIMKKTNNNFQSLFWFTTIPASIGFIILVLFVRDPKKIKKNALFSAIPSHSPKYKIAIKFSDFKLLGGTFWKLMSVSFIFGLARMAEAFLSLHARDDFGFSYHELPIVLAINNLSWCLFSYPIGKLADKMNRYWILCFGMATLILADIIIATATSRAMFYVGVLFWGAQCGITMNIFLSLINETVPEKLRGSALGIYFVTSAFATFICDSGMGRLAEHFNSCAVMYAASAVIATIAIMFLITIMGYKIRKK